MWSSKNRTKVCEWMGYAVEDLRMSSGCGDVWIGVPVWCYTECNSPVFQSSVGQNLSKENGGPVYSVVNC